MCGTTPGPVNCSENPHSLRKTDTCTGLNILKQIWQAFLGSFPACFLEAHQWWGGEPGLLLLPCRPNFRCHFQKKMMALLMFVVFQQLTWEEKSQNKYTKICLSRRGDESRCLTGCYNCESHFKEPEHLFVYWVTDMKYKPILSLKQETHSCLWKYAMGPSVRLWKWLFCTVYWFLF